MDIYDQIKIYLLSLPTVQAWPELQSLLIEATSHQPRDWQLPILACEAVGGSVEQAIPVAAAVACIQQSIILIDDMLDHDPRGIYKTMGLPVTANLASALQAVGLEAITGLKTKNGAALKALLSMNKMVATIAAGQHQDVQRVDDESTYWEVVRKKSSPFYGSIMLVGAIAGHAPIRVSRKIETFGNIYGAMIQIHDDLNDTMAIPANPDWIEGRSPLPILYASTVKHSLQDRFLELRFQITNEEALQEAQQILIRSGAISYCIKQLLARCNLAEKILNEVRLSSHSRLNTLLQDIIAPVHIMLKTIKST